MDKSTFADQIVDAVESMIGSNEGLSRQGKFCFCHTLSPFGIGDSGVSQSSHRIYQKINTDKNLKKSKTLAL